MADSKDFEAIWNIGVFDAHCHPTDIMDSIARIPDMKARVLTVMSTRAEDQDLVEQTAQKFGVRSRQDLKLDAVATGRHDGDSSDVTLGQESSAEQHTPTSSLSSPSKGRETHLMIPAFGWHPWFSHQLWDDRSDTNQQVNAREHYQNVLNQPLDNGFLEGLPHPIPLSKFLHDTEQRLEKHAFALIGEVGLDRSFRIPEGPNSAGGGDVSRKTGGDNGTYTPGSREGRPLTPYKVNMEQQKIVLKAQLELAAKHRRAVSVHSVQAHGVVFEVMQSLWKGHERPSKREQKKLRDAANAIQHDDSDITTNVSHDQQPSQLPFPPRICMHSFSGPVETLRMFLDPKIPADIYVSFSECINFNSPAWKKAAEAIKMVPEDKILIESDLHCAGTEMDKLLESIVRRVCDIKEWDLEQGARILKRNWSRFIFGE